jgi:hypothetical protein
METTLFARGDVLHGFTVLDCLGTRANSRRANLVIYRLRHTCGHEFNNSLGQGQGPPKCHACDKEVSQ